MLNNAIRALGEANQCKSSSGDNSNQSKPKAYERPFTRSQKPHEETLTVEQIRLAAQDTEFTAEQLLTATTQQLAEQEGTAQESTEESD